MGGKGYRGAAGTARVLPLEVAAHPELAGGQVDVVGGVVIRW